MPYSSKYYPFYIYNIYSSSLLVASKQSNLSYKAI